MITLDKKTGQPIYAPSRHAGKFKKQEQMMIEWSPEKIEKWYKRPYACESREQKRMYKRVAGEGYTGRR